MKKRDALSVSLILSFLSGCGGGGGSSGGGAGFLPSSASDPGAATTVSAGGGVTIKEKKIADTFRGGIAIGRDNFVYLSGANGLQIFTENADFVPSSSSRRVASDTPPDTWPVSPKPLFPSGPVTASGTTINALATTSTTADALSDALVSSGTPGMARYDVTTKTWFDVELGGPGDVWAGITGNSSGQTYVMTNLAGLSGFFGEVRPFPENRPGGCLPPEPFFTPIAAATIGPDGNLYVASAPSLNSSAPSGPDNPSLIYVSDLTPALNFGLIRSIALPAGSQVTSMASGSDSVWFTDSGLNAIGRVSTSGSVTLYALRSGSNRGPRGIALGSDGAFWFTERNGNKIGRIDASGAITEFNIPSAGVHPRGIVGCRNGTCPSRALFFNEDQALGKVSF